MWSSALSRKITIVAATAALCKSVNKLIDIPNERIFKRAEALVLWWLKDPSLGRGGGTLSPLFKNRLYLISLGIARSFTENLDETHQKTRLINHSKSF